MAIVVDTTAAALLAQISTTNKTFRINNKSCPTTFTSYKCCGYECLVLFGVRLRKTCHWRKLI